MLHSENESDTSQDKENIIILNASIDTRKMSGKAKVALYKLAARFGKMRNVKMIHVNGREYDDLTKEEKSLLNDAQKIIVMGHCAHNQSYLSDDNGNQMDANKLSDFIRHGGETLSHVSILACQSTHFGKVFSERLLLPNDQFDFKKEDLKITARAHVVVPNPINGKIYNLEINEEGLPFFRKRYFRKGDQFKSTYQLKTYGEGIEAVETKHVSKKRPEKAKSRYSIFFSSFKESKGSSKKPSESDTPKPKKRK